MRQRLLHNQTHPFHQPLRITYCDTFLCRLRGLMFAPSIEFNAGLWMVQPVEDRLNAAIHMFFMNFDITVVWLNSELKVVDVQYARRWRPAYTPARPARYVLETHPDRLKDFNVDDQLVLEICAS